MRDPNRIKRITDLLEKKWNEHPNQRLGQFLMNYVFGGITTMYHQEDAISEERLIINNKIKWKC